MKRGSSCSWLVGRRKAWAGGAAEVGNAGCSSGWMVMLRSLVTVLLLRSGTWPVLFTAASWVAGRKPGR